MNKLAELRKKLADLKASGFSIIKLADDEGREPTDEEMEQVAAIQAEADETSELIKKAETLADARRQMQPMSPAGSNTVNDLNPKTSGGFKGIAEFAYAVRGASKVGGGDIDQRLLAATPANTHQGGASSGEGFEVPSELRDGIFEVVAKLDEFGPMVDEEPTSKRKVEAIADETTPWGSAGIQANWRSEGNQMSATKLATDPRTVVLHELYAFVLATEELLEDAPRLASRITNKAGQAIAWKKNNAMVYGTGAGQPLGWFNSTALVTVAKESGQAADTILALNVINMFSRLLRIPGDKPFWLANSDILPQLMTMTIGTKPIWMPPNGIIDGPGGFLLGLPVMLSEHGKTLGDKGDLQLVSPKGYYSLRREGGPKFAQSMHLYFDYAIESFRWTFRFGGQPHLSAPVDPANGSKTKSHFIALAERA